MEQLIGHWILQSKENFHEFLKVFGIGIIARNLAAALPNGHMTITKIDEMKYRIQNTNGFRNSDRVIELGAMMEGYEINGSVLIGKWEVEEDGKMCAHFRFDGQSEEIFFITREIIDEKLVQKMSFKGCTTKYIFIKS